MKSYFRELLERANENREHTRIGKLVSGMELIPAKVAGWNNKIIFYKNSGRIIYIQTAREITEAKFKKETQQYSLLDYLAQNTDLTFSLATLAKQLNTPREDSTEKQPSEETVRETMKIIRRKLLDKNNNIFMVRNGHVSLQCIVEVR